MWKDSTQRIRCRALFRIGQHMSRFEEKRDDTTMKICGAQGDSGRVLDLHMQMRRRRKDAVETGGVG